MRLYCGTEFTVNRGGGIVSLAPVVDGLMRVQRGVDKTASELAIARLQRDADEFTQQWRNVNAQSYLGPLGWGAFLLILGMLLSNSNIQPLGGLAALAGIVLLVSAFNGNTKKSQELAALQEQYDATVSEIDRHKAIVEE